MEKLNYIENGIKYVNGKPFGFDFTFVENTPTGIRTHTMTFCNFRRYGFSVQAGGVDEQEQGTSQIAFGGYGGNVGVDQLWAAANSCLLKFVMRFPAAIPVMKGEEFKEKLARVLQASFDYHDLKHGGIGELKGYNMFGEFRAVGR